MNILVVEDDPFIALDVQDTIEGAGMTVIGPVSSVRHGLEIVETDQADAAILDYNLIGETSAAIARCLKQKSVPFIFLSGQMRRVIIDEDFEGYAVIEKPFDPSDLIEKISDLAA